MPLDASSTRREVLDAYHNNAAYEENESLAQARAFVSACRHLLSPRHNVKRSVHGGRAEEVELDLTLIERQMLAAQHWAAGYHAFDSGSSVVHADFSIDDMRG
jgi:hypothetical protein